MPNEESGMTLVSRSTAATGPDAHRSRHSSAT